MPPGDERATIGRCLRRLGVDASGFESRLDALHTVACSYQRRRDLRAKSPRIAAVLRQLAALDRLAERACAGEGIAVPAEIFPETIGALVGRYPFSDLELARVTLETLTGQAHERSLSRTAVVGASVEPHVMAAAMHQFPSRPHLLAARVVAFPHAAAANYFFGDLPDVSDTILRQRLESFIVGGPKIARHFIREVHERVCRATSDATRQNPGKRSLYQWAEPSPDARLVFDVFQTVLEPMSERPKRAVQSILIELVDVLRTTNDGPTVGAGDGDTDFMRQDVFSSVLTVWVALNQHRLVARRLASILDYELETGEPRCRRLRRVRLLAARCHSAVSDSAAELLRRAHMGDILDVGHIRASPDAAVDRREADGEALPAETARAIPPSRASGEPTLTVDLAGVVPTGSTFRFLRQLARAHSLWEQNNLRQNSRKKDIFR